MKCCVKGVRISSVCAVVPSKVSKFEDEIKLYPFSERSSRKLAQTMGFKEHRIAPANVTLIDLAEYGLNELFKSGLSKDEINALIFVSQQHEYPVPGNSKVLHNRLKLNKSVHCVDIYENCSGFISGLFAASSLISATDMKTVVLINASAGTCHLNIKDRNTYPIMGDAAGITIIRKTENKDNCIFFDFLHDSNELNTLIIPAGGMRQPSNDQTRKLKSDFVGNLVSDEELHMDGAKVFHFVMDVIPKQVEDICNYAGINKSQIDYFITHQPNKFLVRKLTSLMEVDQKKVFDNIVENFGNSSSATIPVNLCFNLSKRLKNEELLICFSAFGAGMTAGSAVCRIGHLTNSEIIEYPCG